MQIPAERNSAALRTPPTLQQLRSQQEVHLGPESDPVQMILRPNELSLWSVCHGCDHAQL